MMHYYVAILGITLNGTLNKCGQRNATCITDSTITVASNGLIVE